MNWGRNTLPSLAEMTAKEEKLQQSADSPWLSSVADNKCMELSTESKNTPTFHIIPKEETN